MGCSAAEDVEDCVRNARLLIAKESDTPIMTDAEVSVEGAEVWFGEVDSEETLTERMAQVMRKSEKETLERSYTVKINDFTV